MKIYAWLLKHAPQLIAGLILAGLLAWGAHSLYEAGGTSTRLACAEEREKLLEAAMADIQAANAATERKAAELQQIAAQYEQDKDDAKAAADAIAAGLRAGNLKLRNHWQGCRATDQVIAATGQPDEGARLRAESAGRIIAAADEADAQIRGLQRVIEADRK